MCNRPVDPEKPLEWLGSSKKDLLALPVAVRKFFGHALDFAQRGDKHDANQAQRLRKKTKQSLRPG